MSKEIGDEGENLACQILEKMGYKILERNYRSRFGEIDIIAEICKVIVVVEVKYKEDQGYGLPQEAVTKQKLRKIVRTAQIYIRDKELVNPDWRVDVLAIEHPSQKYQLLENVYTEGLS
ncbi:MAG: YraN family protein [bacterium]